MPKLQDTSSNYQADVRAQRHNIIVKICSNAFKYISQKFQGRPPGELPSFELHPGNTTEQKTTSKAWYFLYQSSHFSLPIRSFEWGSTSPQSPRFICPTSPPWLQHFEVGTTNHRRRKKGGFRLELVLQAILGASPSQPSNPISQGGLSRHHDSLIYVYEVWRTQITLLENTPGLSIFHVARNVLLPISLAKFVIFLYMFLWSKVWRTVHRSFF